VTSRLIAKAVLPWWCPVKNPNAICSPNGSQETDDGAGWFNQYKLLAFYLQQV